MDLLKRLGIRDEKKAEFATILFYFMRECHINPLDEEYVDDSGKTWKKKGMSVPLFLSLMKEMQEHYKREQAEYKKAR